MLRHSGRVVLVVALVAVVAAVDRAPSWAVTKAEVDEACAEYRDAKQRLDEAIEERDAAQARYAGLYADREVTSDRADRLHDQIAERREELDALRDRVVEWAVEAYMAADTEISGIVLRTHSLEQLVTGQEFLKVITTERVAAVDRLIIIVTETEVMQQELDQQTAHLLFVESEAHRVALVLAGATDEALDAARELKGECRRLYQKRQAELARARAIEAARRSGGAGGVSAVVTPGFICPMNPGAVSFINDWSFPRSGGRKHRGNDLFAPMRQPVKAVTDGSVLLRRGGLGGYLSLAVGRQRGRLLLRPSTQLRGRDQRRCPGYQGPGRCLQREQRKRARRRPTPAFPVAPERENAPPGEPLPNSYPSLPMRWNRFV